MIYQIKISIIAIKPTIWRRLLVDEKTQLEDLHRIIQTSMGWTNSHLHAFIKNRKSYRKHYINDDLWDEIKGNVDYRGVKLSDLLFKENQKVNYEYDFGDSWMHQILLERKLTSYIKHPICIDGKRKCPPENCGGISGYDRMIKVLQNPNDQEYYGYINWLGGKYNPEQFDLNRINLLLLLKNYGIESEE